MSYPATISRSAVDETLADLALVDYKTFARLAWPHVVQSPSPLAWAWFHAGLCDYLQAIEEGRAYREGLIIMPPNTAKSTILSQMWPAWVWLRKPWTRFLYFSNSESNAQRDANVCKRLIESEWFRRTFRPKWRLRHDKSSAEWHETTEGGARHSLPILSEQWTGKKGDQIIGDDPNDAQTVLSAAKRKAVNDSYVNKVWDRGTNNETVIRLVAGQRTEVDDLIGHVQTKFGWPPFFVREEYDPRKCVPTPIGPIDPRRRPGELLRPSMMSARSVEDYKKRNKRGFDCKHNGDPRSRDGNRYRAENLRYWRVEGEWFVLEAPGQAVRRYTRRQMLAAFATIDGAASAKQSADYTVISSFLLTPDHDLVWIGCRRVQLEIPDQIKVAEEEYDKHRLALLAVETVAANVALYQFLVRTKMNVISVSPRSMDKLARAVPAICFVESKRLWLPAPGVVPVEDFPLDDVFDSLTSYTGDEKVDVHDDIEDTLAYAVDWKSTFFPDVLIGVTQPTGSTSAAPVVHNAGMTPVSQTHGTMIAAKPVVKGVGFKPDDRFKPM